MASAKSFFLFNAPLYRSDLSFRSEGVEGDRRKYERLRGAQKDKGDRITSNNFWQILQGMSKVFSDMTHAHKGGNLAKFL
jgi:hypothetical protein